MAKKEFKNAAKGLNLQDALLESTGQAVPQKREGKQLPSSQATTPDTSWDRFTVVCSCEIIEKIKTIARKESFTIREVVEKYLGDGIRAYESKYGEVVIKANKVKKNIEEVL